MNNQLCPETLKAARLARSLSLSDLSKRSGISAPSLSRLEGGNKVASSDEAASIAEVVGLPIAALCRSLVSDRIGLSAFYHRKLKRAGKRIVNAIENQCALDVVALRELVGMVNVEFPADVPSIDPDDIKNGDVEEAANMLRLMWQIPRGPIHDLCSVVEKAGCLVIHTDFGVSQVDALYHKVAGMWPIFWVNSCKPLDRVRWSIAHELGHLLLHTDTPTPVELAEDQANTFASAFLMPRSDFRGECPSRLGITELIELKRRWRCSMQAIIRRAWTTGRITDQQYKSLNIMISRRGWRTREPYPISGESPHLLAKLIDMCLHNLQSTDAEFADRLAVPVEKLIEWKQPFPGYNPNEKGGPPRLRLVAG